MKAILASASVKWPLSCFGQTRDHQGDSGYVEHFRFLYSWKRRKGSLLRKLCLLSGMFCVSLHILDEEDKTYDHC